MKNSLLQKYNVPGPRYTIYPTVPYWDETDFSDEIWAETLKKSFQVSNSSEDISLYIHLPFCESLCTFCGCNKRITKNHGVENPYIEAVLKEWMLYCKILGEKPTIKAIHLGCVTPTFFSTKNLEDLINGIFSHAKKTTEYEFSFEGHPNNTSYEHLQKLYDLGFRRVSFGIQDYSEKVQKAIHREQPFHNVAKVTFWAREIGCTSIGHDIIFGLPYQKIEDVIDTIEKTKSLQPDQLAFYSYPHVPCIKDGICKLTKLSANGKDHIVKLVTKGELLGQRSMISDEPVNLSAVALEDMQVCFIPKSEVMGYFDKNNQFSMNVIKSICGDLKEADDQTVNLAQKTVK